MDDLMRAIVENYDDDAPRLVWADRVGGDRGELVVLQCAIAARRGTREDRVRMQARVRELLPRFAKHDEVWRRGFCERFNGGSYQLGERFAAHPTLRELDFQSSPYLDHEVHKMTLEDLWLEVSGELIADLETLPPGQLRVLEMFGSIMETEADQWPEYDRGFGDRILALLAEHVGELDALVTPLGELTRACLPSVQALGLRSLESSFAELFELPGIERLGMEQSQLVGERLTEVLSRAGDLIELDLDHNALGEREVLEIARTPFRRLASLGLDYATWTREAAEAIAALQLTELRANTRYGVRLPLDALLTPSLRSLSLNRVEPEDVPLLCSSQLESLHLDHLGSVPLDELRKHIPLVNDG